MLPNILASPPDSVSRTLDDVFADTSNHGRQLGFISHSISNIKTDFMCASQCEAPSLSAGLVNLLNSLKGSDFKIFLNKYCENK